MALLTLCGQLLFRTRNVVFPLLLVLVCVTWPPIALDAPASHWLTPIGLGVVVFGQGLRVFTIGLDYIRRGGRNGRIYARRLVTGGLFSLCRNPMYTGNVAMVVGFFAVAGNPWGLVVGSAIGWLVYRAIIAAEESFLAAKFGADYAAYCCETPRWLPSPAGLWRVGAGYRFDWAAVVLREYGTLLSTIGIVLALLAIKSERAGSLPSWAPFLVIIAVVTMIAYGVARFLKKTRRLRPLNSGRG